MAGAGVSAEALRWRAFFPHRARRRRQDDILALRAFRGILVPIFWGGMAEQTRRLRVHEGVLKRISSPFDTVCFNCGGAHHKGRSPRREPKISTVFRECRKSTHLPEWTTLRPGASPMGTWSGSEQPRCVAVRGTSRKLVDHGSESVRANGPVEQVGFWANAVDERIDYLERCATAVRRPLDPDASGKTCPTPGRFHVDSGESLYA